MPHHTALTHGHMSELGKYILHPSLGTVKSVLTVHKRHAPYFTYLTLTLEAKSKVVKHTDLMRPRINLTILQW